MIFDTKSRTRLLIPHHNSKITFLHPPYGRGNYSVIKKRIDEEYDLGVRRPNTDQIISLIYSAIEDPEERYSKEIMRQFAGSGIWAFDRIIKTKNGLYIIDDTQRKDKIKFDESKIQKELKKQPDGVYRSGDERIRFVDTNSFKKNREVCETYPYRFIEIEIKRKNDIFLIALSSKEGAKKICEVAEELGLAPHTSFDHFNKMKDGNLEGIVRFWCNIEHGIDGNPMFDVEGIGRDGYGNGYGVLKY